MTSEGPTEPAIDSAALQNALATLERRRDQLLPGLLAAQGAIGWLPPVAIERVAAHIRVPVSEVYATATAYSELRLAAPVPGRLHACTGITCREAGANALLAALGERGAAIDCRFACALAPVIEDGDERLYGRSTVASAATLAAGSAA